MTAVLFVTLESAENGDIKIVEHEVTGSSYNPFGSVIGLDREETVSNGDGAISDACSIMALCNDARLIGHDDFVEHAGKGNSNQDNDTSMAPYTIEGEPTEAVSRNNFSWRCALPWG